MSKLQNGISTIIEAWRDAAELEEKPTLPSGYDTDNRCLPNISSVLNACQVSVKSGAVYQENQLIKYEDLIVSPRTLSFILEGQTKTAARVKVTPSMITSFTMNDVAYTTQELTALYDSSTGIYSFNGFQSTRIHLVIEATNTELSIVYTTFDESFSFSGLNNTTLILRDSESKPLTEARYIWKVDGRDIDLNLFIVNQKTSTPALVGVFGYPQKAANGRYWFVPIPPDDDPKFSDEFPESGCDFCLSLDKDDTGGSGLTETLSIYPVDMTWNQIMQNYDFVYSARDFRNQGDSMVGMEAKLSSNEYPISSEISLISTQSVINAWLICRFGKSSNGQIVEYKTIDNESVVFDSNSATVPAETSQVGISLQFKSSNWG